MTHPLIPEYGDYEMVGRVRMDATIALANSDPILIARGLIAGATPVHKFGAGGGIGTALKPITTSLTYQMPQTAQALEILSDDPADDGTTSPRGAGAWVVRVIGIAVWADGEVFEDVVLEGTTPVALTTNFLRVYRMKVSSSGIYADQDNPSHDSLITLRGAGAGVTWGTVMSLSSFGLAQTEIACYSVPAGKQIFMSGALVSVEATRAANIVFCVREGADIIVAPYTAFQAKIVLRSITDSVPIDQYTPYGPFTGPCDLIWLGEATANTANLSVDFDLIIFDV